MPNAHVARVIATSTTPISYGGDLLLVALNLLLMLAGTYLAGALWISEAADIWRYRKLDQWNHPVTAVRVMVMLAGMAAFIRCGAEAATILGWDPRDPTTGAVVLNLKHYFDPVAVVLLFGWMTVRTVSKRAVNAQLRQTPLKVPFWSALNQLIKPAIVVVIVAIASFVVVYLRGH